MISDNIVKDTRTSILTIAPPMQTTATAIFTERKVNVIVLFFADGKINCNIGQLNENTPVLIKLF